MNIQEIKAIWDSAHKQACVASLSAYCCGRRAPIVTGLYGWVFEQTIRCCLKKN